MTDALIAFGANLGEPAQMFAAVAAEIAQWPGVARVTPSSLYKTAPVGEKSTGSEYVNACLRVATTLSARELFERLQVLERTLGRTGKGDWAPRAVDLDLVLFGSEIIDEPDLAIPHPRMHYRRFVLEPAAEVAGELEHPLLARSIHRLNDVVVKFAKRRNGNGEAMLVSDDSAEPVLHKLRTIWGEYETVSRRGNDQYYSFEGGRSVRAFKYRFANRCVIHADCVVGVGIEVSDVVFRLTQAIGAEDNRMVIWNAPVGTRKCNAAPDAAVIPAVDISADPEKQLDYFIASLAKPVKLG